MNNYLSGRDPQCVENNSEYPEC